ncbi:ABC transporter ATP-binding protein [Silvibacterium dinghuense]|uniref:ABC transporter ATP-binding protein n=1 Tax=Silvibacterium dinghuense TaxID=1560006 RepID=UPI0013E97B90|nr:ABC transporter ATP-binding protein [Silvibacterium dinghuense]GGH00967.1 heme ABC transporter ATP-binding protein [Silvibacterium dinghuense]
MNHVSSRLLEVKSVSFSYGSRSILSEISFHADEGEFVALLGINGSGKSTLLDVISGFRTPASGEVKLRGRAQPQWRRRELAQQVSHLPQSIHADLPFTAEQLVGMGRYPHTDRWFESGEDHRHIRAAMERTSCWTHRHRAFRSLSGGERQRVLVAACLAQDAVVMLLDEPSTFLDIEQQLHCFNILRDEAQAGKLCIAATHDLNLALTYCTRLIVLADGAVAYDLSTADAHQDKSWLRLFSKRLDMATTPTGAPWVWYQ